MDWKTRLLAGPDQLSEEGRTRVANLLESLSQLHGAWMDLYSLRARSFRGERLDQQIATKEAEIADRERRLHEESTALGAESDVPLSTILELAGIDTSQITAALGKLGGRVSGLLRGLLGPGDADEDHDGNWGKATRSSKA
jgi:hypothetical protein